MSGYNLPDDCSWNSDLDYAEARQNYPRWPECAVCGFEIPTKDQDDAAQCAYPGGCTRWICKGCRPKVLVEEDYYCGGVHIQWALEEVLKDVREERDGYHNALVRIASTQDYSLAAWTLLNGDPGKPTAVEQFGAEAAIEKAKKGL